MDCPRCHFSASTDVSQCPFCGWRLSRAFSSISLTPPPPHTVAPASPADALVIGPTPFARIATPLDPRAPVTPLQPADAFVLVPPASPLRQTSNPGLRRPARRRLELAHQAPPQQLAAQPFPLRTPCRTPTRFLE
jgi:hypothetical protein